MPSLNARPPEGTLSLRRTLFSLIVAGVALALAGGALGFATATETTAEPALPALPATFGVPDARHGDVIVYDLVTYVQGEEGILAVEERWPGGISFSWGGDPDVYDDQGIARVGHVLEAEYRFSNREPAKVPIIYDDSSPRRTLQGVQETNVNTNGSNSAFPLGAQYQSEFVLNSRWWNPKPGYFCMPSNALQGHAVDTAARVALFPTCAFLTQEEGPALFLATSAETVDGKVRLRFEHVGTDDEDPNVVAVFAEDIAYPVALEIGPDEDGRTRSFELVGRVQGLEPLRTGAPALHDAAPLAWAATPAWGIDDASLVHPFKLSEAYAFARDDPTNSSFREWSDAHPDAFVQKATYSFSTSHEQRSHSWRLEFSDGSEGYALVVTASEHPLYGAAWPTKAPGLPPTSYLVQQSSESPPQHLMPTKFRPPRTPTAASLLARWADVDRSMGGNGTGGNAYGLTYFPWNEESAAHGAVPGIFSTAGLSNGNSTIFPDGQVPLFNYEFEWQLRTLEIGADGGMRWILGIAWQWESSASPTTKPYDAGGPGAGTPLVLQNVVSHSVTVWRVPTGQEAIHAGVVAAIAGLLYWLWPALKTALVAPFYSRVVKPRALEHPSRDLLHDLIRSEPGLHFQELARRTGWARGTLDHHLRKLVDTGIVTEVNGEGYTCYFVAGAVDRRTMLAAPLLKSEGARAILKEVQGRPGSSISDVARAIGVTAATAHHHVRRLEAAGVLRTERHGKASQLFVAT